MNFTAELLSFICELLKNLDVRNKFMESTIVYLSQFLLKCERAKIHPEDLESVIKCFKLQGKIYFQSWQLIITVCLLEMPEEFSKAFRSPESCGFCSTVDKLTKVREISQEQFEQTFAYTGTPVIVVDATNNWTAPKVFDFWYLKNVYRAANRKRKIMSCQFFPYQSGFNTFFEALDIPRQRVNFESGTDPWYFGWSNCNSEVSEILRKHYTRPYFLPAVSENNPTDWIFMGGPGLGAHMHIDNVRLPSWQAQLRGSKQWTLAPPPECYFECRFFSAIIKEGEIIVLDTNKWYHKTNVLPGKMSITIGAEYD